MRRSSESSCMSTDVWFRTTPFQRAAVRRLDPARAAGGRAAARPSVRRNDTSARRSGVRDLEGGHAGRGQPAADERGQRVVVAGGEPRHDARPALSPVSVPAMAPRASALVPAAAGTCGLGHRAGGNEVEAQESDARAHGRGKYHERAKGHCGYSSRETREAAAQRRPQAAAARATSPAAPRTRATVANPWWRRTRIVCAMPKAMESANPKT